MRFWFPACKKGSSRVDKVYIVVEGQADEMYFDLSLEALNNKIEGKEYKISELPSNLAQELEKFKPISVSNN